MAQGQEIRPYGHKDIKRKRKRTKQGKRKRKRDREI